MISERKRKGGFTRLDFDGEKFGYSTRMSSEKELDSSGEYAYMLHFTGDMRPQAAHRHYEYYVLVNDPNVTWEESSTECTARSSAIISTTRWFSRI